MCNLLFERVPWRDSLLDVRAARSQHRHSAIDGEAWYIQRAEHGIHYDAPTFGRAAQPEFAGAGRCSDRGCGGGWRRLDHFWRTSAPRDPWAPGVLMNAAKR